MKDLKYLLAYLLPISAWEGLAWGGWFAWKTVVLVFGLVPVLEWLLPQSTRNVAEHDENIRSAQRFFDILLYLNVPILYGSVGWYHIWLMQNQAVPFSEILGNTLAIGLVCGTAGINVAHELGHRASRFEQFLSKVLLLPNLYLHFFIEHNRGHHKHVATPHDPASAPAGENLYAFWLRSVAGSWMSAWQIQRDDLRKNGLSFFHFKNEMLVFQIVQIGWLGLVFFKFGTAGLVGAVSIAAVGFLLLETVNYIEHYGLRRKQLENGRFEPVLPRHSWNSNHEIGRILLYELTRHSDHHFKSSRKFQVLRHFDDSPQLPLGYPGSLLLALVPPLWFWRMNRELAKLKIIRHD